MSEEIAPNAPRRAVPSKADAMIAIKAEEERRKRAARQAAKVASDAAPPEMVKCRVTHMGDGRISMGEHVGGLGEVHFEKNEQFETTKEIAEELQERGLAEIL